MLILKLSMILGKWCLLLLMPLLLGVNGLRKILKFDGTIYCCQARLVAQEYKQVYGIDHDKIFAPGAKMASICHS